MWRIVNFHEFPFEWKSIFNFMRTHTLWAQIHWTILFPFFSFSFLIQWLRFAGVKDQSFDLPKNTVFFIKYCRQIELNWINNSDETNVFYKKNRNKIMQTNRWLINWNTNLHFSDKRKCVRVDPFSEVRNANAKKNQDNHEKAGNTNRNNKITTNGE